MSKQVLIVLGGLPASGKSTYAQMLAESGVFKRVCPDLIRKTFYGDENIQGDGKRVFETAYHDMKEYACMGENVVFDATNINAQRRKELVKEMRPYFDIIIFKWFDVATAVCLERNRARERQVPEEVIWRMARTATVPTLEEGFDYVEIIINY